MPRFALTIFLSAFLLFQVQPLLGKYILPWFGGTTAIWITCMLFFQVVLLFGYLYAHLLSSRVPWKAQGWVHLVLLAATLIFLPIAPSVGWKPSPEDEPTWRILMLLLATIGLPYLMLSATGPLLQHWFAGTFAGKSPWRLYALSNVGSLLALVSYPFVVEPKIALGKQVAVWSWLFIGFLLFCGWSAIRQTKTPRPLQAGPPEQETVSVEGMPVPVDDASLDLSDAAQSDAPAAHHHAPPTFWNVVYWIALAAFASAMMLSTTSQLTQEVSGGPFLWVLPLSLYLITFIICFDNERWYNRRIFGPLLFLTVPLAAALLYHGVSAALMWQIIGYCAAMFACCMGCHGELVRAKPDTKHLTLFYLTVSAGGALGGLFVAVIAPLIFTAYWEYHVVLVGTCVMIFIGWFMHRRRLDRPQRLIVPYVTIAIAGAAAVLLAGLLTVQPISIEPDPTWTLSDKLNSLFSQLQNRINAMDEAFLWGMAGWPALMAAGCAADWMLLRKKQKAIVWQAGMLATVVMLIIALSIQVSSAYANTVISRRNFYGILRVNKYLFPESPEKDYASLVHGRIMHGFQYLQPDRREWITSYYAPTSGIGLALRLHPKRGADETGPMRIGVTGLGSGSLAAYAQKGDYLRYYEINPAVQDVAENYFTYLRDARKRGATVEVHPGDARIVMEREVEALDQLPKDQQDAQKFDVLILDAFSSDAIPIHLLTVECMDLYWQLLKPDGLLMVHISNRFVDLEPVVIGLGNHYKITPLRVDYRESDEDDDRYSSCTWITLTKNQQFITNPMVVDHVKPWKDSEKENPILWTDDFHSLWPVLDLK